MSLNAKKVQRIMERGRIKRNNQKDCFKMGPYTVNDVEIRVFLVLPVIVNYHMHMVYSIQEIL
jgi:hypothetical protein